MFTVKLAKGGRIVKIIEGRQVDIDPGRQVSVTAADGQVERFSIGRDGDSYGTAYVENADGKTTEIVRA